MTRDRYPVAHLVRRLYDVGLFIFAVACLFVGLLVGLFVKPESNHLVVGLGMAGSFIAAYLEFRQRTVYKHHHMERSILSGELRVKYLRRVAILRNQLASANILIVLLGVWVSAYGSAW